MERIIYLYEQKLKEKDAEVERLHREVDDLRRGGKELKEKVFQCEKK